MLYIMRWAAFLALIFAVVVGLICVHLTACCRQAQDAILIVTLATMLIFRSVSQYMMNEMGETDTVLKLPRAVMKAYLTLEMGIF